MKIGNTIIALIAVAIFGVVSFMAFGQYKRSIDLKAIHDCSQDYRQEFAQGENVTIVRPLEQQVRECAWNKGVRGWVGIWSGLPK